MKKIILFFALFPMLVMAQQPLQVSGCLTDALNDTLIVSYPGAGVYDSIVMRHGNFSFTIPLREAGEVLLTENHMSGGYMRRSISFYGQPGETVNIHGTFTDYQFGGSPFYRQLDDVNAMQQPFRQELQANVQWGADQRARTDADQEEVTRLFHERRTDIMRRLEAASIAFMRAHADYEAALLLLPNIRDVHQGRQAYDGMSAAVRQGRMSAYARPFVERYDAEIARLKVAEGIQPGLPAPLFTLNDLHGHPLSLESLRGRYVLLDFWGSWCFWCLAGVPQMKAYYDKYHDRFEILGIDCNDTADKWKAAVEKHQMSWQHVQCVPDGPDVPKLYAVNAFPTKILINPDGTINRVFVGEKEEFYHYLDQLFGK